MISSRNGKRAACIFCLLHLAWSFHPGDSWPKFAYGQATAPTSELAVSPDAQSRGTEFLDTAQMAAELQRLAKICDRLQLNKEAELCRSWQVPFRADQRTLYLPVPVPTPDPGNPAQASWCRHFTSARQSHARWLFKQAEEMARTGRESEAFQTLWHVLREDPAHVETRRILGPLADAVDTRARVRRSLQVHPDFRWPGRSYSRLQTLHFLLTTRGDARESARIATRLEVAHALWSQLFFDAWAAPGLLAEKFEGSNQGWRETRQMDVFLLKDREDYIQTLGVSEANIGASVGYYNPGARKSFFYPDDNLEATFFHELTHQLFNEGSQFTVAPDVGSTGGAWMLEGIALYMESLQDHGHHWTVGGFEAPRLQTARYRAVRDGYWPDWNAFSAGTVDAWKADANVALYYSHAAGLTHMLLDRAADASAARSDYMAALRGVYEGRDGAGRDLIERLGSSEELAKENYQELMTLGDAEVRQLAQLGIQVQDLVLAGSRLQPDTWRSLAKQTQLQWLDLAFSNATTADLDWIGNLLELQRLSVEGSGVDGGILSQLAKLPDLEELDLSGCQIADADVRALMGCRSLATLWLTKTRVTANSLETLAKMPALKFCDVQGTDIPPDAWQAFEQQHFH